MKGVSSSLIRGAPSPTLLFSSLQITKETKKMKSTESEQGAKEVVGRVSQSWLKKLTKDNPVSQAQ